MTDASLTGAALTGFLSGLSLIVAIGAQNAFVLRLGILRSHVLPVVVLCALSDAVLVTVGVFASAGVSAIVPGILPMMRWGGAAFLLAYGARSALAAWRGGTHLTPQLRARGPWRRRL